jgi:hypothetical protein
MLRPLHLTLLRGKATLMRRARCGAQQQTNADRRFACYAGVLVCWCAGVLVCWCAGVLVCWCAGVLVCDPLRNKRGSDIFCCCGGGRKHSNANR